MKEQKILSFARKSIYDRVKYLGKWKGFEVWEPGFSDGVVRYTGFPQFILVKGSEMRWTRDDKESQSIMDALWN